MTFDEKHAAAMPLIETYALGDWDMAGLNKLFHSRGGVLADADKENPRKLTFYAGAFGVADHEAFTPQEPLYDVTIEFCSEEVASKIGDIIRGYPERLGDEDQQV